MGLPSELSRMGSNLRTFGSVTWSLKATRLTTSDAWARYLPSCHPSDNKGDGRYNIDNQDKDVADVTAVMGGMAEPEVDIDDAKVAFEERAATLEYDGGLDRQQAEQSAEELGPLPSKLN